MKITNILYNQNPTQPSVQGFSLLSHSIIIKRAGYLELTTELNSSITEIIGRSSYNSSLDIYLNIDLIKNWSNFLRNIGWTRMNIIYITTLKQLNNHSIFKEYNFYYLDRGTLEIYSEDNFFNPPLIKPFLKKIQNLNTDTIIIYNGTWDIFCFNLRLLNIRLGPGPNHYRAYNDGLSLKLNQFLTAIGFTLEIADLFYKESILEHKNNSDRLKSEIRDARKLIEDNRSLALTDSRVNLILDEIYTHPQKLRYISPQLATFLIQKLTELDINYNLVKHLKEYVLYCERNELLDKNFSYKIFVVNKKIYNLFYFIILFFYICFLPFKG
jgi:hypothetical protein